MAKSAAGPKPSFGWLLGIMLALGCCGAGLLVAFALDAGSQQTPPLVWVLAICAVPSVVAGALLARQFSASPERNGAEDPLTGLHGERKLAEALVVEHARALRIGKRVGLVIAELEQDGRMSVPHYLGWRAMAKAIKATIRLYDGTFVLSPGRFAILLSGTTAEGGDAVIVRLRKAFEQTPELRGAQVRFGQALADPAQEGIKPEDLLHAAVDAARTTVAAAAD